MGSRRLLRIHHYFSLILINSIASCHALFLPSNSSTPIHFHQLSPRRDHVITTNPNGTIAVIDPTTQAPIPQGAATDGGGKDFSPPALIWIIYCCALGLPLALAGIRGWRATTGVGISICFAVASWAAIVNAVNETGLPDLLLTVVVMALSFLGFILGIFHFAYMGGVVGMVVAGGLSVGVRVVLIQPNLLVRPQTLYAVNWILPVACAVVAGLLIIRWRRGTLLFGCASVGTFLVCLGVDLIVHKQSGMSRGLRYLFDRNSNHLVDILGNGYQPTLTTRIFIAVSLGVIPILAYAQHRIFPAPFNRKVEPSDEILSLNYPTTFRTAFSGFWEGAKLKQPSRFSM